MVVGAGKTLSMRGGSLFQARQGPSFAGAVDGWAEPNLLFCQSSRGGAIAKKVPGVSQKWDRTSKREGMTQRNGMRYQSSM